MNRVKTFAKYAVWIILFWILSEILIYFGINSTYRKINEKNVLSSQITITRAEATTVNGRINGTIQNNSENDISGKYLKIDLYSSIGNLLGTKYLEIGNINLNESKDFETYFKVQEVKSYDITIVDNKEPDIEGEIFMSEDLKTSLMYSLLFYMLIH